MSASRHLGPQFHGTTASLPVDAHIEPGHPMAHGGTGHHTYMTRSASQAAVYASRAFTTSGHVYEVEPTGPVEPDPSHTMADDSGPLHTRSSHPLRVVRHVEHVQPDHDDDSLSVDWS